MHPQGDFPGNLPLHHFLCLNLSKHPESSVHSCCYGRAVGLLHLTTVTQALGLEENGFSCINGNKTDFLAQQFWFYGCALSTYD